MIEVRVSIGLFDDLEKAELIRMQLGALPRIGEAVLMTPELKRLADKRRKEWGVHPDTHVNIVKRIGYDREATPVLMLSTHPSLLNIGCIQPNGEMFELPLAVVPRVGEQVITPDETVMYIEAVTYTDWKIFLQLSERVVLQEVRIADTSVPVEIINGGPIEVYDRQLERDIDVHVTNRTLHVENSRDY